jgi:rubrerythrin
MLKSFEEVIAFAISREAQAANFYEIYGQKTEKLATKSMFQELAAEEKKHKELLEGLTSEQLSNFKPKKIEDLGLSAIIKDSQFSPDMEYADALRMAIKREEESINLYLFFAEQAVKDETACKTPLERNQLKKLFNFLVEQEKQHKNKLEAEYDAVILKDY